MTMSCNKKPDTVTGLAAEIGVSRQSLYDWHREGCPIHAGVEAIRRWHRNNKRLTHGNREMRRSKLLEDTPEELWAALGGIEQQLFGVLEISANVPAEAGEIREWLAQVVELAYKRLDRRGGDDA